MKIATEQRVESLWDHESSNDKELLDTSRALSRKLRTRRLNLEKLRSPLDELPQRPDVFFEKAPNGDYPIVAFRTVPCAYHLKGYCHPCSYSSRSYPAHLSRGEIEKALSRQLDWLLGNFDAVCLRRADGELKGYHLHNPESRPTYMLQLAGMSSFFSDLEMPADLRRTILERLVDFQEQRGIILHVMLETRPEHLVAAADNGELSVLQPLLQRLNAVVNMGFEARNDFLRNMVFAKNMKIKTFESAVAVAQQYALDPGIFLFAGGFILTTAEVLAETRRNLSYLQTLGVFANVMVPNLQRYTIPDLLYEAGAYALPEPYFLLDLAEMLGDFIPARLNAITPFHWFIGGLVADPAPRITLLNHPRRKTSKRVTNAIADCLHDLVENGNRDRFLRNTILLRKETDFRYHLEELCRSNPLPWKIRIKNALEIANGYFTVYDDHISMLT